MAAAGRVGDFSQQVINTMDEPSSNEQSFQDALVQKAKNVATSTAQLVLRLVWRENWQKIEFFRNWQLRSDGDDVGA